MNLTPENSIVLASAIAYAKKEIRKHIDDLKQQLPEEFSDEQKKVFSQQIIQQTLQNIPIKQLPPGIIYESHLNDVRNQLVAEFYEKFGEYNETFNNSYSNIVTKIALIESVLSTHDHPQYSLETHAHDEHYSKLDHDHENYVEKTDFENSNNKISENIVGLEKQLSSKIDEQNQELKNVSEKIYQKITSSMEVLKANTSQYVNDILEQLSSKEKILRSEIDHAVTLIQQNSYNQQKENERVAVQVKNILDSLQSKVDYDYKHPQLAEKDHQHYDLAKLSDLNDVKSEIKTIHATEAHIKNTLFSMQGLLQSKLSKAEALTKQDLQDTVQFITNEVIKNIPAPVPGKDATEWQFRLNPNDPSIFQFKKETDQKWTSVIPPHVVQPQASFLGVGGGGADFRSSGDIVTKKYSMSGTSFVVTPSQHSLTNYYSYRVYKEATGEDVAIKITENNLTFSVHSIVDMSGLVFQVKGI